MDEQLSDTIRSAVLEPSHLVFDNLPLAAFAGDAKGQIVYTNPAFHRLIDPEHYSHDLCTKLEDLESLFDTNLKRHWQEIFAGCNVTQIEPFTFTNRRGRIYYLSMSLSRSRVEEVTGIIYDLTESSEATAKVERHLRELKIIEEISRALHSTMRSEEILRIILAAATCKEGLGFNRAFLFLRDQKSNLMVGKMAIGPSTPDEAGRIWAGMNAGHRSLSDVLQCYLSNVDQYDIEVNHIVRSMKFDPANEPLINEVIETGHWINIDSEKRFREASESGALRRLHISWCSIVPVLSKGQSIGVIVADNLITGRPIEDSAVRLLQVFASHASTAIEHAQLFEEVERKAHSLEEAQKTIERVQQQINAIERISLASEISHKISHELRNPLTIIGGFAALLKSKLDPADKLSEHAQIIVEETARLENAMTEVLNFSKSFALEKETVDLNEIGRIAVEVFVRQHESRALSLAQVSDSRHFVCVNKDQAVQSLYDILEHIDSALPASACLSIRPDAVESRHRLVIWIECEKCEEEETRNALSEAFDSELQGSSLRMTLAFETIRYNGGEPGIEIGDDGHACVFIAYPVLEVLHV